VYLGRLPQWTAAQPSLWREIKGYKNYVVIGSEATNHGVQIFDMSLLLDVDPAAPKTFSNEDDLTGWFGELPVGRSHNVVVNEEKNYAVAVGAQPRNSSCASGLIFIDLTDPSAPYSPGCASGDGYVHDAQCLVYRGPDEAYSERDICYGYNEDTLTIFDVTDKNATNIISRTTYEGASYTHQGWVLDTEWQQYLVLDDEYDEYDSTGEGAAGFPVTYFWDISSLEAPKLSGIYRSDTRGIDHNQFISGGFAYQSNYGTGLRVLDISSIAEDPTAASVKEVAFFDIFPEDDDAEDGGVIDFEGTWSHYPFFKSGFILVNTIERGAFVVKRTDI
jgi:choice-of-anchor B domain-containing protein